MVLRDAAGLVVDSLNYGGLVDPWAAEGYQGTSPGSGSCVAAPSAGGRRLRRAGRSGRRARSERGPLPGRRRHRQQLQRFPVADRHRLWRLIRPPARTISKSPAWQTLPPARRLLLIRARTARPPSSRRLARRAAPRWALPPTWARPLSLSPARQALAPARPSPLTVARTSRRRLSPPSPAAVAVAGAALAAVGWRWRQPITVAAPLTIAHAVGAQVSGTGITFTTALTKAHASGAQVGSSGPTPGAPNQFGQENRSEDAGGTELDGSSSNRPGQHRLRLRGSMAGCGAFCFAAT